MQIAPPLAKSIGKKVGVGRIEKTQGAVWSLAGETADVGMDAYSPVTDDYDPWTTLSAAQVQDGRVR